MSVTVISLPEQFERFTPSTRETIRIAQREALRMHAVNVEPEHLLLGCIIQNDERAMDTLNNLGIDAQAIRAQLAEACPVQEHTSLAESDLPLSKDAQECIRWALAFISYTHISSVFPEQLLLGVLQHKRTQPILSFLLPSVETLRARITEDIGPAYTSYMDQLIRSRVRNQSVVSYGRGTFQRVLRKFERPVTTFIDVLGLKEAKHEMRDVVEFLKATPTFQLSGGRFPHKVLLIGSTGNDKRLLLLAVAGEAVVPLITFSMQALVEMLVDLDVGVLLLEDLELPVQEYSLFKRGSISERGQRYIQHCFHEARDAAPCILHIEDVDAMTRLEKREGREMLLRQILVEMDALDSHYRMVVFASTNQPADLDPSLLRMGRFERRVVLASLQQEVVRATFCVSCRRTLQPEWQFCVYCGTSQARVCAQCGSLRSVVEGARFCSACGGSLV